MDNNREQTIDDSGNFQSIRLFDLHSIILSGLVRNPSFSEPVLAEEIYWPNPRFSGL